LARTLARVLDVPFSVSDATSFTQVLRELVSPFVLSSKLFFPGRMLVFPSGDYVQTLTDALDVGEDVEMAIQRLVSVFRYSTFLCSRRKSAASRELGSLPR
jgi:hypothetical protein